MVLAGQLEVSESHRHGGSDAQKDDERQAKDAVQGVRLPAPQRSENVIKLDGDGAKGQKTAH